LCKSTKVLHNRISGNPAKLLSTKGRRGGRVAECGGLLNAPLARLPRTFTNLGRLPHPFPSDIRALWKQYTIGIHNRRPQEGALAFFVQHLNERFSTEQSSFHCIHEGKWHQQRIMKSVSKAPRLPILFKNFPAFILREFP
jgi:hypothetical protein